MFGASVGMNIGIACAMLEREKRNKMASWKNRSLYDCEAELARLKMIRGKQQGVLNNLDTQLSWLNIHIESKTPVVLTHAELEAHFGKPVIIAEQKA